MAARRPHLLLITTDRHRYDCLGLHGHPVVRTPNLDQIGAQGVDCRHASSEVPSCIAARRILLTGLNQVQCGLVGYQDEVPWDPPVTTLPARLSAAGYHTQLVGKLHQWPPRRRYGYDRVVQGSDLGEWHENDYTAYLREHGFTDPRPWAGHGCEANAWIARPWHLEERFTHSHWCATEAIRFLERRDPTQPFFLHLSFVTPHPPLCPPAFQLERYLRQELPGPVCGDWSTPVPCRPGQGFNGPVHLDPVTAHEARAGYYGLISHVDDQVGRVMSALLRLGLRRDTLVMFTSDHGEMLGDHYYWGLRHGCEATTHVSLLVHAPAWMGCGRGTTVDQPVGLQDVAPTLLDAAGVPVPEELSGRSLLPLLRGEAPPWRPWLHLEHEHPAEPNEVAHQTLTDGRTKYSWLVSSGAERLFDLTADPQELHDLARERPAEVALWRARLIGVLHDRPEGFVQQGRLVAGRPYRPVLGEAN